MLVSHHVEEIPPGFRHALVLADGVAGRRRAARDGRCRDDVLTRAYEMPITVEWRDGRAWARKTRDDDGAADPRHANVTSNGDDGRVSTATATSSRAAPTTGPARRGATGRPRSPGSSRPARRSASPSCSPASSRVRPRWSPPSARWSSTSSHPAPRTSSSASSGRTTSSPSRCSSWLVALLIGAGLGLLARRRYAIAAAIFVVFGVVGFVASLGDPLAEPDGRRLDGAVRRGGPAGSSAAARSGPLARRRRPDAPLDPRPQPAARDAGLVAPFVPHPRERRRGRRVRGGGRRPEPARAPRTAPVGDGPAVPPASVTVPPPHAGGRPVDDGRRTDPDRHAQRQLLPDRHRAPDPERLDDRLDAAHPRPRRPRDDADLGRSSSRCR